MSRVGDIIYRHINENRGYFSHAARTVLDDAIREVDEYVAMKIAQAAQTVGVADDQPQFKIVRPIEDAEWLSSSELEEVE